MTRECFVSSTISKDEFSKVSFNLTISFRYILCLHYFNIYLYMSTKIIANTKIPDCGCSRNGTHKLSVNLILDACLELIAINHLFLRVRSVVIMALYLFIFNILVFLSFCKIFFIKYLSGMVFISTG